MSQVPARDGPRQIAAERNREEAADFVPSDRLVAISIRAALRARQIAEERDLEAFDDIWVAPEGPPANRDAVPGMTRRSIGERVNRMLAALALREAAAGRDRYTIGQDGEFSRPFQGELRARFSFLAFDDATAEEFFGQLFRDLYEQARMQRVQGAWGDLEAEGQSLIMRLETLGIVPSDRPRSTFSRE